MRESECKNSDFFSLIKSIICKIIEIFLLFLLTLYQKSIICVSVEMEKERRNNMLKEVIYLIVLGFVLSFLLLRGLENQSNLERKQYYGVIK